MSSHIHTWIDGHLALRERAYDVRGGVEVHAGSSAAARWPRTTGADVIAIAALVTPSVRAYATPGVLRRWHTTLADLERVALLAPRVTYSENRAFWSSLESVAIVLDDLAITPPSPALWDALIDQLGAVVDVRNAGALDEPPGGLDTARNAGPREDGPFVHFEGIQTYDDLWSAQKKYLADKRGSDTLAPPTGFGGGSAVVPRTTNADVLQLATYWTDRLASVKHEMGHDGIVTMWQAALADVDKLAKPGAAEGVYAKNNEFWASSRRVAIQIAISDEAPSRWDMAIGALKDSALHLPQTIEAVASKGADLLASAANAVGRVANEAGKGLFAGFGTPLLIGAGLLGVFLISRGHSHEES